MEAPLNDSGAEGAGDAAGAADEPSVAAAVEESLESQRRTRALSLRQLTATHEAVRLAERALGSLVEARAAAQDAAVRGADGVLQAVETELRRYADVGADADAGTDAAVAPQHTAGAGTLRRLATVLLLVERLGSAAAEASAERDAALERAETGVVALRRTELALEESTTALARSDTDAEHLRTRLSTLLAARANATPASTGAADAPLEPGLGMPRRLDGAMARAGLGGFAAAPPSGAALAELLASRDALQTELAEREAALAVAHRTLADAQATAASAARADAEAALEQANRQVRSLSGAVKRGIANQEGLQAELRVAAARAKAAEEDAAALRTEAQLARVSVSKLTRALANASVAAATPAAAVCQTTAAAAEKLAADAASFQQRATAALSTERAATARLQRELDAARADAERNASRSAELEHALRTARAAALPDLQLRALVQELARAEAAAREQLSVTLEDARRHAAAHTLAADACAAAVGRAEAAEAVQLRMGAELAAARERIADMAASMGQIALRHDKLQRAEAALAAEKDAAAATEPLPPPPPPLLSPPAPPPPPPPPSPPPSPPRATPHNRVEVVTSGSATAPLPLVSALADGFVEWRGDSAGEQAQRASAGVHAPLQGLVSDLAEGFVEWRDDQPVGELGAAVQRLPNGVHAPLQRQVSALADGFVEWREEEEAETVGGVRATLANTIVAPAAPVAAALPVPASLSAPTAAVVAQRTPALPAADAKPDAPFAPTVLSSDDDEDDDGDIVGPDAVRRAAAAQADAERTAAQLTQEEAALRHEEEKAAANNRYAEELAQGARGAVAAAAAALSTADADADPRLQRSLAAAKERAEQEALRAEENARVAAAAVQACAARAATAAEAAAVARATATAKAFTAARMVNAERRHADFRAKLSAVQAQAAKLTKQLQKERAACDSAQREASALMAVVCASGPPDMVADAKTRGEALSDTMADGAGEADFPPPGPSPSRWDDCIRAAAEERDRLSGRLATARAQKVACEAQAAFLGQCLSQLKSAAAAGHSVRPPPVVVAHSPPNPVAGLFGRRR
jgi:hypothetical protein